MTTDYKIVYDTYYIPFEGSGYRINYDHVFTAHLETNSIHELKYFIHHKDKSTGMQKLNDFYMYLYYDMIASHDSHQNIKYPIMVKVHDLETEYQTSIKIESHEKYKSMGLNNYELGDFFVNLCPETMKSFYDLNDHTRFDPRISKGMKCKIAQYGKWYTGTVGDAVGGFSIAELCEGLSDKIDRVKENMTIVTDGSNETVNGIANALQNISNAGKIDENTCKRRPYWFMLTDSCGCREYHSS